MFPSGHRLQELTSRYKSGACKSWLRRPPTRGERPLDNLSGITEPCVYHPIQEGT